MKKKTIDLYRAEAICWADMVYVDALRYRILLAKQAMDYYRSMAGIADRSTEKYLDYIQKYKDSEEAVAFNRKMLAECEK